MLGSQTNDAATGLSIAKNVAYEKETSKLECIKALISVVSTADHALR